MPPILRPEVLAAAPELGEHLLVYQTASGNDTLPETLARSGVSCRIYGLRRDLIEDAVEGNLTYRPFSEAGFIDDLRTARAVVAGGGFTLLSEAIYLRKPILSIPAAGQFEQELNALYLEDLGYGAYASSATDSAISVFLERLPDYERALAGYEQDGNTHTMAAVGHQLEAAADGIATAASE